MLSIGRKIFLLLSGSLIFLVLLAFLVLERGQSREWEQFHRLQNLAFARFATTEVLKLFRGDFSAQLPQRRVELAELLAFNRNLAAVQLYGPGGRLLFDSGPFIEFSPFNSPPPDPVRLTSVELSSRMFADPGQGRVLDLLVPARSPSGQYVLSVRYLVSFRSLDESLATMRRQFALIGLAALVLCLALSAAVARWLSRPLKELSLGAHQIAGGNLDHRLFFRGRDELSRLGEAFNLMAASLKSRNQELLRANVDLARANEELGATQQQLVRSERLAAVGQLAAGVSHEIDNPVGIILGYAELMLHELPPDASARQDLQVIIDECRRCRRITGGLLGLARPSTSVLECFDIPALLRSTLDGLRPQKLFRTLELDLDLPSALDWWGHADPLRQVLINLLLNAAQALGGQGRIRVSCRRLDGGVELLVEDSGPGVAAQMREKVFEPFFSTKKRGEGTGLGLSVCRKLAEEQGGNLILEDSALGGAALRLFLPQGTGEKDFDKVQSNSLG